MAESNLYSYMVQSPYDEGHALNDSLITEILLGGKVLKTIGKGAYKGIKYAVDNIKDFSPYAKDAWQGRKNKCKCKL